MVTLKQMEELLDTKLSKLENRIVKSLTNHKDGLHPNSTLEDTKQVIVIDETNLTTPVRPSPPAKSFYDECSDLQIKQVHDSHYNIIITFFVEKQKINYL